MIFSRFIFPLALALGCCPLLPAALTITLTPVISSGLSVPVYVTHAGDGSGRLFVVQQDGRIRIINSGGSLEATDFLNLSPTGLNRTNADSERGLLGLAFHPNYQSNGRFFVHYTNNPGSSPFSTVIAQYTVSGNPNVANTTETPYLTHPQPQSNHNGGSIEFGPDGNLYIALGDGGGGGDTGTGHTAGTGNGQDTADGNLLGKILRVNVEGAAPAVAATGNPFIGIAGDDRIWAHGLRNPFRISFDRLTGRCFVGDVGQNRREEVTIATLGANCGWRVLEGTECFNVSNFTSPLPSCTPPANYVPPISDYPRSEGTTVTGGYVYRGTASPDMQGIYIFADFGSGRFWSLTEVAPGSWTRVELLNESWNPSSFGEDEAGELYVCDYAGRILRVNGPPPVASTVTGFHVY